MRGRSFLAARFPPRFLSYSLLIISSLRASLCSSPHLKASLPRRPTSASAPVPCAATSPPKLIDSSSANSALTTIDFYYACSRPLIQAPLQATVTGTAKVIATGVATNHCHKHCYRTLSQSVPKRTLLSASSMYLDCSCQNGFLFIFVAFFLSSLNSLHPVRLIHLACRFSAEYLFHV